MKKTLVVILSIIPLLAFAGNSWEQKFKKTEQQYNAKKPHLQQDQAQAQAKEQQLKSQVSKLNVKP